MNNVWNEERMDAQRNTKLLSSQCGLVTNKSLSPYNNQYFMSLKYTEKKLHMQRSLKHICIKSESISPYLLYLYISISYFTYRQSEGSCWELFRRRILTALLEQREHCYPPHKPGAALAANLQGILCQLQNVLHLHFTRTAPFS